MSQTFCSDSKWFVTSMVLVIGLYLVFMNTALAAQSGGAIGPVKGEVVSFDGKTLTVKTGGGETTAVVVPEDARVSSLTLISFADIKTGDFIASAGKRQPDGTLHAVELRIFPEEMRGRGEGHRPARGGPDSTMTNATVDSVVGIEDRTLKVKYPGGEKTIVVPEDTPVMRQEVADKSLLTPGAPVSVTAREESGQIMAVRISVGKDGLVPPL
jgi:hypothetical protein